jgi:hypothetical protein
MIKKYFLPLGTISAFLVLMMAAVIPVTANPQQPQAYYNTPTASADGRIIYIVKPGDTCTSISLLTGVSLDDLRLLNDLTGNECLLIEGQELLLGIAQETAATPETEETPTPLLLIPTPFGGIAEVCIFLFLDENGNALAEEGEIPLAGGAVSITDRSGEFSQTGDTTDNLEPLCFTDVPEGDYNISVAIPEGYNATTIVNYPLTVEAGDRAVLDFGAQPKAETQVQAEDIENNSSILAILGGVFILAGIGFGIYVRMLSRRQQQPF